MYVLYTAALAVGLVLTFPYYLIRFRKYMPTIGERLGFIAPEDGESAIWIHAVSVGEVKAIDGLIAGMRRAFPQSRLIVSTTTPTGRALALERGDVDRVIYFPLDLPGTVRRSLDRIRPELVVVAETEIWPNFLRRCSRQGVPVFMVNGRISDKSYRRYKLGSRWLGRVLEGYRMLGMQSNLDAERIRGLGAPRDRTVVFGNLKYDAPTFTPRLDATLNDRLSRMQPLLVAASTASGEEPLVLEAYRRLRGKHPALKLLIAPRRPERFDEVEDAIQAAGFSLVRRSRLSSNDAADVLLLDSIGELTAVFEHAAVVFMGGTLVSRGGHNILEPARFQKPVVFGPHMENFRDMARTFLDAEAAIEVRDAGEFARRVSHILSDPALAAEVGRKAAAVAERNAGATGRALAAIRAAMNGETA